MRVCERGVRAQEKCAYISLEKDIFHKLPGQGVDLSFVLLRGSLVFSPDAFYSDFPVLR